MSKVAHIADAIIKWGLLFIIAAVPVVIVPLSWFTIPQAKLLFVGLSALVVFVAWVISIAIRGSLIMPRHLTLWGSALLPIVYLISAAMSGNGWSSLVSGNAASDTVVVVAIWYLLLLLVTTVYARVPDAAERMMRAMVLGLLALMSFQIVRAIFPDFTTFGGYLAGSASSLFGAWHDLGIVAGLGVFISLAFRHSSLASHRNWRTTLRALGITSFAVLVIVNSVDVWYALAITALLYGLWQLLFARRIGHGFLGGLLTRGVATWMVLMLLAASCGFWSASIYNLLPSRLQVAQLEVRPSWQGTYMIGEKTLSDKKAFVFGSGPNTFTRDWSLFKPAGVNVTDYWNVDFTSGIGFIPTTFVTIGFLGIIAWLLFAVSVLWSLFKAVRGRTTMHGMLPAIMGVVIYLFVFHVMYVPGVALSALLFLMVGLLVALESGEQGAGFYRFSLRPEKYASYAPVVVLGVIGLLFVLAPIISTRALISDLYIQRAVVAYNKDGNLERPLALVKKSLAFFPQNDLAHRAAVQIGLLQLQQMVNAGDQDDAARAALQTKLQDTISHGLSAVSINSNDYQNWLSLATLYQNLAGVGISGAYENAKQAYERATEDNPTSPLPHAQLAQLALSQGDMDTALVQLDKAIELKPNLGVAYYLRSQIHASRSDFEKATQDAAAAAQLAQQDPLAWYNLGAVFYAAGQYEYATQALSQAVTLQNNYANALFLLGLSWDKLGKQEQALAAMREVQKLNPDDTTIEQAIQNLEAGRPAVQER